MGQSKKKQFLQIPRYSGGKELLRKFLAENLKYPAEALEKGIQGDVIVAYKINSKGEVFDATVEKGIGYGCDEEAVRLVKLLKHDAVKNKGVRVTASTRLKVPFRLKKIRTTSFTYEYKTPKKRENKVTEQAKPTQNQRVFTYTIKPRE
ncbi:MAG TPA: energy transducer TonB [Tenuifilaceae bacterium]|nr:energy transducer TonB [Tenuifilaceae bacterium]HPE18965.1 energy transducer TonB [Tenuifilaceae bacterium]HPJ46359.1 energy transducer TonB [Tenuifilaceae bacterium]HPQ34819.1 energy transducer TonB [Tenuifilaceae bacterium]HRX68491.1 energy transducer TonB [Tenuifilaceae bacterium]